MIAECVESNLATRSRFFFFNRFSCLWLVKWRKFAKDARRNRRLRFFFSHSKRSEEFTGVTLVCAFYFVFFSVRGTTCRPELSLLLTYFFFFFTIFVVIGASGKIFFSFHAVNQIIKNAFCCNTVKKTIIVDIFTWYFYLPFYGRGTISKIFRSFSELFIAILNILFFCFRF